MSRVCGVCGSGATNEKGMPRCDSCRRPTGQVGPRTCSLCGTGSAVSRFGKARCRSCSELSAREGVRRYEQRNARACRDCQATIGPRSTYCRRCWNGHASQIAAAKRRKWEDNQSRSRFNKYGVTPEQWDSMLARQSGGCAICGSVGEKGANPLVVDHDHDTGAIRGVLCRRCNAGLGQFRDQVPLLQGAIEYLRQAT